SAPRGDSQRRPSELGLVSALLQKLREASERLREALGLGDCQPLHRIPPRRFVFAIPPSDRLAGSVHHLEAARRLHDGPGRGKTAGGRHGGSFSRMPAAAPRSDTIPDRKESLRAKQRATEANAAERKL